MAQFKLSDKTFHGARIKLSGATRGSYAASHCPTTDTSHLCFDLNESYICWDGNGKHHAFTMGSTKRAVQSLKGGNFVRLRTDVNIDTAIRLACAELFEMDEKSIDYRCAVDGLKEYYKHIGGKTFGDFKIAMTAGTMTDEETEEYIRDYASQKAFTFYQVDAIASAALRYWKKHNYYKDKKNMAKEEPADE